MRHGFGLAEVRGLTLPEAEAYLDILYPQKTRVTTYKSKRQDWRAWKRRNG